MQTVSHLLHQKGNEFFWVAPTDSVLKAIELMATHKVILKQRSSQDTSVSEIMTSPAVTVTLTDTVRHCMEMMTQGRFRHLPVVEAGRVFGILSIGDLVKAVIEEQTAQIEQLERYIAG